MREWISVEERLPDTNCDILACGRMGFVVPATFVNGKFGNWLGISFEDRITHWMPLPEPPKPA